MKKQTPEEKQEKRDLINWKKFIAIMKLKGALIEETVVAREEKPKRIFNL